MSENTNRAIKFHEPYISGGEKANLESVFDNDVFAGNGPFTKKVQSFLEQRYEIPHVLLTHSCTGALELSALLLDLEPGDQVILPSYNFVSAASAFMRAGAELVFCEIDPASMNIDIDDATSRMTERTRAIIPVHYGGIAVDLDRLGECCAERDVLIIEDAAQGLDASYGERWLGTISPLATMSFHETKNIHCGLGGALFINDADYFERAEDIWERGTNRTKMFRGLVDKYSWVDTGSSFYPSELQAAFLLAQLESLNSMKAQRRVIYEHYSSTLSDLAMKGLFALPTIPAEAQLNFHSFFIICNSIDECDALREYLLGIGIQAFIGYVPLHSSKMGQSLGNKPADLPVTEEYAHRVLRLPFHCRLDNDDLDYVCDGINRFFQHS